MKTAFTAIIFNGLVFLCNYKLVCGLREFLDNQVKQVTTHTKSVRNGWLVIHSLKSCKIEFRTNQRKTFPQVLVDHPTVGLLESIWSNRILIKKSSIIHCIYDVAHPKLIDQKMQGMPPKHEDWLEPRIAKMSGTICMEGAREGPGITQRPNPLPGVCQDIDQPSHPHLSNKKRIFFVPDDMFAPSIDV